MAASINTEALTRIPLPAILADHGYGLQQTGPGRFLAESPDHAERLSISRLPDGKWLYRDQNHHDNKGNALHFMQAHGHPDFQVAANALTAYTQPERRAEAQSLLNDLDHRYRDAVSATGWRILLLRKIHQGFRCRILGYVSVHTANISAFCRCGVLTHESNGVIEGCLKGRSRLKAAVQRRRPVVIN